MLSCSLVFDDRTGSADAFRAVAVLAKMLGQGDDVGHLVVQAGLVVPNADGVGPQAGSRGPAEGLLAVSVGELGTAGAGLLFGNSDIQANDRVLDGAVASDADAGWGTG